MGNDLKRTGYIGPVPECSTGRNSMVFITQKFIALKPIFFVC